MVFQQSSSLEEARMIRGGVIALYGIYESGELVFIGSTTSLRRRLMGYLNSNKFASNAVVQWNEYKPEHVSSMALDEKEAVLKLKPKVNGNNVCLKQRSKIWREDKRIKSVFHQIVLDLLLDRIENSVSKLYVLDTIAENTELTFSWLTYFSRSYGDSSPSVDRLEILYEYLTGKKFQIKD